MKNKGASSTSIIFKKLVKKPVAWASFSIISIAAFVSIFAYFISSDNTQDASLQQLSLKYKPIGYSQLTIKIPLDSYSSKNTIYIWFFGKKQDFEELAITDYKIENNNLKYRLYAGDGMLSDYKNISLKTWTDKGIPIEQIEKDFIYNKKYLLGTDSFGRDFYSRLIIGTRISFFIGFVAVGISLIVGVIIGAIGGYYRGRIDTIIMWLINVIWSIPTLLLVMAITLAIGKGFWQIFIAVGLTMWVEVARVVRGQFLSYREKEFVEAAKALGMSDFRIMFKQILPNIITPLIVISAANFAAAILIESGLSFLGIGAQPPTPSWGNIIKEHYSHIITGKQHLAILPGLLILLLVLAFNIFGNMLRDSMDLKK